MVCYIIGSFFFCLLYNFDDKITQILLFTSSLLLSIKLDICLYISYHSENVSRPFILILNMKRNWIYFSAWFRFQWIYLPFIYVQMYTSLWFPQYLISFLWNHKLIRAFSSLSRNSSVQMSYKNQWIKREQFPEEFTPLGCWIMIVAQKPRKLKAVCGKRRNQKY